MGDLPDPGIKPISLAPLALAGGFLTTALPGELYVCVCVCVCVCVREREREREKKKKKGRGRVRENKSES